MSDFRDLSGVSTLRAALAVVMIGILVTGLGLDFIWQDRGHPREATTTGTLTRSYPTGLSERRQGTIHEFEYATPAGQRFRAAYLVTPSGSLDREGDTVTVLYPPDAPAAGRPWITRSGLEFLPLAGGIALTLGGLRVVIREMLKRRRRATRSHA